MPVTFSQHRSTRGFTLFELAVAVAIIAILIAVLLSRLSSYSQAAEQLAFQQTLAAIRAQVRLQAYQFMIAGRPQDIATLVGKNPIDWLEQKPLNYAGEFYIESIKTITPGSWFFDKNNGTLIYLLNKSNTLTLKTPELLQFKVSLNQAATAQGAGSSLTLEMVPEQANASVR